MEGFFFTLQNPDATKAKLISRMAKMGQPMLPFLTGGASQPESSDSELEVGRHNVGVKQYVWSWYHLLLLPQTHKEAKTDEECFSAQLLPKKLLKSHQRVSQITRVLFSENGKECDSFPVLMIRANIVFIGCLDN